MKIGHIDSSSVAPAPAAGGERAQARKAAPVGVEPSTKVDLSAPAALVSGNDDVTFDKAKVERMAQAIRDGTFTVNAEAIADKLIANAQEVLGRPAK
jgi:negative regulator of flagellin synthesis FlgM